MGKLDTAKSNLIFKIDDLFGFNLSNRTDGISYDFGQYKLNKLYKPLVKYFIDEFMKHLGDYTEQEAEKILWLFTDFYSLYYSNWDFGYFKNKFSTYQYRIPYSGKDTEFRRATKDCYYVKTSDVVNDMAVSLWWLFKGKEISLKLFKKTKSDTTDTWDDKYNFDVQIEDIIDEESEETTGYKITFINREESKDKSKINKIKDALDQKGIDYNNPWVKKTIDEFLKKRGRDYFIHKRLKAFLIEELERYFFQMLKNNIQAKADILNIQSKIEEIKVKYSDDPAVIEFKIWQLMKDNTKDIKLSIYETAYLWILNYANILWDLEEFKAKLWNKKRNIIKQEYCISIGKIKEYETLIPRREELFKDILSNKGQIEERKELGITNNNLIENDFLVIDTKHFTWKHKDWLIEIAQTHEILGKLFQSENYQALNFLQDEYNQQIKCIYIDPPYNTDSSPIAYKNWYIDSSWLSLMENRLTISSNLMTQNGIIEVAIDDAESNYLSLLLEHVFWRQNYITQVSVLCNPQWRVADMISKNSDFHYIYAKEKEQIDSISIIKKDDKKNSVPLKRTGTNSRRTERPNRYYPILEKDWKLSCIEETEYKKIYSKDLWFDDNFVEKLREKYSKLWYNFLLPKLDDWIELVWQRTYDRVCNEISTYTYRTWTIYTPPLEEEIPKTCWISNLYSNPKYWTEVLKDILWRSYSENTPKSIYTVMDFLILNEKKNQIVLDYFAWTWTTWHAIIKMNKEFWWNRQFLLVEMWQYFDKVTLTRIKKVLYTDNWKEGIAQDNNGTQWIIEYSKLNQYEDRFSENGYLSNIDWDINQLSNTDITTIWDIKQILYPLSQLKDKIYRLDDEIIQG